LHSALILRVKLEEYSRFCRPAQDWLAESNPNIDILELEDEFGKAVCNEFMARRRTLSMPSPQKPPAQIPLKIRTQPEARI
jgi:hypothetical protein